MNIEQMSIFICKRLVVFNVFSTFEKKKLINSFHIQKIVINLYFLKEIDQFDLKNFIFIFIFIFI